MRNLQIHKFITSFSLLLLILVSAGCHGQHDFKEKRIIVKRDETVRIKELGLSITNSGCGRKWVSEGNKPSFERPFCDLEIKHNDSTYSAGHDFRPVMIGDIQIDIEKMNVWGREEDSVPPGGCRLLITRLLVDKIR